MNPFHTPTQINPEFKQVFSTLTKSSNPMQMIEQLASNNPTMQPVLQALHNGANPEQLFYQLCSSYGVNPQDILNQLK